MEDNIPEKIEATGTLPSYTTEQLVNLQQKDECFCRLLKYWKEGKKPIYKTCKDEPRSVKKQLSTVNETSFGKRSLYCTEKLRIQNVE